MTSTERNSTQPMKQVMKRVVVCGIGNRLRGDDAVGPLVIDELKKKGQPETTLLLDCGTVPEGFAGKIIGFEPDIIIIVDAVRMNRPAGEVAEVPIEKIKHHLATTHKMPVTLFIDYLQRSLPNAELTFIGIQQAATIFGEGLSNECRKAIATAAVKMEKYSRNRA